MPKRVWVHSGERSFQGECTTKLSKTSFFLGKNQQSPCFCEGFYIAKAIKSDNSALARQDSVLFLIHSLAKAGSEGAQAWQEGKFLASTRIQLGPAKKAAQQLNSTILIRNIRSEHPYLLQHTEDIKICIIGKLSHPDENFAERIAIGNLALVPILKRKKIPLVVTYSDNLASKRNTAISELYKTLLWHADHVVYPCKAMVNLGRKWYEPTSAPLEWIIEDPCQVQPKEFKDLRENEPCRIIWFGHSSNSMYLFNILPSIMEACDSWPFFELHLLTDKETANIAANIMKKIKPIKPWSLKISQWDTEKQPQQLEAALGNSHIAILPSDPKDPRKLAASHNRAVDAITAGCMTIASPISSYLEIKRAMLITKNFSQTLNSAIKDYTRLTLKWDKLRNEQLQRFSPGANLDKWKNLISTCMR